MSSNLVRLCGLAAVLGGALWALKAILDENAVLARADDATDALFFVVPVLLLAGSVGLYIRYAGRVRGWGGAGFIQTFTGLVLIAGGFAADLSFGLEGAERASSFGFLILAFGLVLLGFDTLKFEALPRWNALPLAMGLLIPLSAISGSLAPLRGVLSVLFGLGWVLLGYLLVRSGTDEVADSRP